MRAFTFGETSRWIRAMLVSNQKEFFNSMGLPTYSGFRSSSLQALTLARNYCAHNQRIWNNSFPVVVPKDYTNALNGRKISSLFSLLSVVMTALELTEVNEFNTALSKILQNVPAWQRSAMGY